MHDYFEFPALLRGAALDQIVFAAKNDKYSMGSGGKVSDFCQMRRVQIQWCSLIG